MTSLSAPRSLFRLAWLALGFNVLVILWGAVVRATGSGAGCGAHWPTCNGSIVPLAPSMGTLIEYSHRATSGIALLLVALLLHRVLRHRDSGHLSRFWATASMVLILSEAALGAGLVLFERVAGDASTARGFWVSGHLINTFLLLAALTLTVRFVDRPLALSSGGAFGPWRLTFSGASLSPATGLAALAIIATGISGAIAALGDTLFKARTLSEALAQDFSSSSHIFLRLRILHPLLAMMGGGLVLMVAYRTITSNPGRPGARTLGLFLGGLVVVQWFLGLTNLVLLAPTWLQIVHLLMADLIWMTLIFVAADSDV